MKFLDCYLICYGLTGVITYKAIAIIVAILLDYFANHRRHAKTMAFILTCEL